VFESVSGEEKKSFKKYYQVSISPTFYEQLLQQNPLAKKLQTQMGTA